MDKVLINGKAALGQLPSIIDTGTTLIIGDSAHVRSFYAKVPGARDASSVLGSGFYAYPCSSPPQISFMFGGRAFPISPQSFSLGRVSKGSSYCVGGIVGESQLPFWIVGDVFLRNVYSVFDLGSNRVGFATLK